MTAAGRLVVVEDAAALAAEAARRFLSLGSDAIRVRGRFTVALSGGHTPRAAYERIAATWWQAPSGPLDWSRIHLFWGDERFVPPDSAESNYRMVREALLDHVPFTAANIHRVETDRASDAADAAARYEATLRQVFGLKPGAWPRLDLVFLGMGADGHTASLFPGTGAPDVADRLVTAVRVERLGSWRVSLTLPVLNYAADVIFLVTGADKAVPLRSVVEGPPASPPYPAGRLRPSEGSLVWLADRDAAPWAPEDGR
ncbi:MAG: 6-phosphogluconolactonase [Hyphomicrobiales bacterium]